MDGWSRTSIGEIAEVQSGAGFPKKYQGCTNGDFPFAKVSDMNRRGNERSIYSANNWVTEEVRETLKARVFPKGSIVFPKIGAAIATNKKRIVATPCCVDNNVIGLIPNASRIITDFLYYWLLQHDLTKFANDSELPSIRKTSVEAFPLLIPDSLPNQKRIVAILDKAFAAIDTATANTKKNLANARELFESQLEHEFTDDTVNEGWMSTTLGNVCSFENGDRGKNYPSRSAYVPEGMPFVNAGHLGEGWVMSEGLNYISKEKYELLGSGKFNTGDILFCLRGSLGKFGVVGPDVGEGAIASSLVIVRPKLNKEVMHTLSPEFLSLYFRSAICTRMIDNFSGGVAQPNLGARDLANFKIVFPPLPEQKRIVAILDKLSSETRSLSDTYNTKLNALAELKQSLLRKSFCGEL